MTKALNLEDTFVGGINDLNNLFSVLFYQQINVINLQKQQKMAEHGNFDTIRTQLYTLSV